MRPAAGLGIDARVKPDLVRTQYRNLLKECRHDAVLGRGLGIGEHALEGRPA
jgi:hypothetical protein